MGLPYDTKPVGGITVGAEDFGKVNADGTRTVWPGHAVVALRIPSRINIVKVIIEQTDDTGGSVHGGSGDSFTVDLFNQRGAADDQVQLDANDNPLGRDLFRVMSMDGVSGKARYDADNSPGGYGFPYFNQDENQQTPVTGVTDRLQQNQRVLYVVITGTDGDVFSLVVGTDSDIHGI